MILLFSFALLLSIGQVTSWNLPKTVCNSPVALRTTTKPTTIVGTGTAASCTQAALEAALAKGGIITFQCGSQPVTIPISSQLNIIRTDDTTIDGGDLVTLDGLGKTRIFLFDRGDYRFSNRTFTIQRLRLINGYCTDNGGGCAILQKSGGTTVIINCVFENNIGAVVGQDTAGGAVWTMGGGDTTVIRSVFIGNRCSNGGALGILGSGLIIYNSHFERNQATGVGGNPGNGGNGGAISFDGRGRNNTICGTRFSKNEGNKNGGAFFRVSYNGNESNIISNTIVDSNTILASSNGVAGGLYIQDGAITMTNTIIYNNSAGSGGGMFLSNNKNVFFSNVNLLSNQATINIGGAIFCSRDVQGTFTGLTVANNYATVLAAAFTNCQGSITLANTVIANNTAGNVYSSIICNSMMNNGNGIVQSPITKPKPANGVNAPCANGTVTQFENVSVTFDVNTFKIKPNGATVSYLGPTVLPGL